MKKIVEVPNVNAAVVTAAADDTLEPPLTPKSAARKKSSKRSGASTSKKVAATPATTSAATTPDVTAQQQQPQPTLIPNGGSKLKQTSKETHPKRKPTVSGEHLAEKENGKPSAQDQVQDQVEDEPKNTKPELSTTNTTTTPIATNGGSVADASDNPLNQSAGAEDLGVAEKNKDRGRAGALSAAGVVSTTVAAAATATATTTAAAPKNKFMGRMVATFRGRKPAAANSSPAAGEKPLLQSSGGASGATGSGGGMEFDELAMKKAKQAARNVAPTVELSAIEDLPKELARLVTGAKIPDEKAKENFEILLNCLHFLTKHCFVYRPVAGRPGTVDSGHHHPMLASTDSSQQSETSALSRAALGGGVGEVAAADSATTPPKEPSIVVAGSKEGEGETPAAPAPPAAADSARVIYIGGPKGKKKRKKNPSTVPPESELLSNADVKRCYRIMEAVGQGGFGRVHAAKNMRAKGRVAIKKMPHVEERDKQRNLKEVNFLRVMEHSNLVKYDCAFLMKDEIWVVMEFMEGGTLTEAIKGYGFEEKHIAYAAREMLRGIQFMHSRKFLHRDLKSANIMMTTQGEVKLIDFGLCLDLQEEPRPSHMVGSPFWMPPEMIKRKVYGPAVDIYSFAICILELANGQPPHRKSALKAMFIAGTTGHLESPFQKESLWSPEFKDFITSCLAVNPKERATAAQLLHHPFLDKAETRRGMKKLLQHIFLANTFEDMSIAGF
eukprot:TRINITY_DN1870_c2_g1_i5.p1 TRINITY_DN1870_c2_g1~~TRINITY_DN1870_c2_g1_i5.p1  ORF type:complete len:726 (+),score=157.07 TRINITY_DN1870_c2_g1_i5:1333-3510(+)